MVMAGIDNQRFEAGWLDANDRIRLQPQAAHLIAQSYGRDWKTGRRTAVCAAGFNTPLWQEAVAKTYPRQADLGLSA
jgi:hypothetical protein